MHRALESQEILSNIFACCCQPRYETADLPAFARTCRAFKEPALDALWAVLEDASPLARCLPDASHQMANQDYAFSRPLTRTEWEILHSYTRRIRAILDFAIGLDWKSVKSFLDPPGIAGSLFPSLRNLCCGSRGEPVPWLHIPLPSLNFLYLILMFDEDEDDNVFEDSLKTFPTNAPNIRELDLSVYPPHPTFNNFISCYILQRQDLQQLRCKEVSLDLTAFLHLSRMPALNELTFELSTALPDQIPLSISPLFFSNLRELDLHSVSLAPISKLLSLTRLPAIADLTALVEGCPSKEDVFSFFTGINQTIQKLRLVQLYRDSDSSTPEGRKPMLDSNDLRPCMAFSNLRDMNIDLEWNVNLTEDELRALASTWPHLDRFVINDKVIDSH